VSASGHSTDVEDATKREGPGAVSRPPDDRLARGAAVGRYLVVGELGAGGMGVVYAAYDPELDRKVAIKLLQASAVSEHEGGQAWLLREAQAMARLSHPNAIAVYDVGTLPPDRVFVAMELVDGPSLRAWLGERARSWREVVAVFIEAGRGLAAAHASGLVHRDFKPDNVLVGKDRVRVMDFGLARLQADRAPEPPDHATEVESPLSQNLTIAGVVIGTPAYMAPEVRRGEPADPRSDQYAFGVALYEGLYGDRPFPRDPPADAKPRPVPADTNVPARVHKIVARAISRDRAARFASMDELLIELARAVGTRRRGWLATSAVGAVGAAVAIGLVVRSHAPAEVCTGFDARLAGAWDAPTKLQIKTAFEATKRPFAAREYAALEHAIDAYASDWVAAVVDNCKATRVRGEQTEDALSLRQACLDRRRDELRALAGQLTNADASLVQTADKLATELEPIARCSDVAALRAPGRPPTEPAAVVAHVLQSLADAKAALVTGRFLAAINAAKQAERAAELLRYTPFKAEALVFEGVSLAGAGNFEESGPTCTRAVWESIDGHRDDVVSDAAMCAAVAASQRKLGEAQIWLELARRYARRAGIDPEHDLRMLQIEGIVDVVAGRLDEAIAAQQQALAAGEQLVGRDSPELWRIQVSIGASYARAGAYAKAIPHFEDALVRLERLVGEDHPDVPAILSTLGACYAHVGAAAKARAAYERAVAIDERVEGPSSATLVATLNNMADSLIKSGDPGGALVYLDRASQVAARTLGDANPVAQAVATTRAEALAAAGRLVEARAAFDAVIALEIEHQSPLLGSTWSSRMASDLAAKQWADAAADARRAIAAIQTVSGTDSPDLVQPLAGLGRAELALGRKADARAPAARALALAEAAQLSSDDVEPLRKLLAELDAN